MAINYLNSINLNKNELIQAQIENQANDAAAGTGVEGQLYYNTTDDVLKVWSDGSWSEVGGGVITLTAGTYLTNSGTAEDPIIDHDATSRTDGTSTASPGYGGAFDVVDSVTSNATGHVTAINVKTVTLPPSENDNDFLTGLSFDTNDGVLTATVSNQPDVTVDLDGRYLEGNQTITLSGDVTGSGETSIITTIADGAVEFDMIDDAVIVTEADGVGNNDNDTTVPTTAAVKDYVDSSVAGQLVYQGGYNANTNTPNLDTPPTGTINRGFTYTVTVDGLFFTEQVRVGDLIIAEVDSPTTLADWTTVQNNIDLADASTVGIGNVDAGTGIDVSYADGTATVSLTAVAATSGSIAVPDSATYTYPNSITASSTNNVLIQLVDSNGETVYADVQRLSTTTFSVNYGVTTPTGVIALIQLIG